MGLLIRKTVAYTPQKVYNCKENNNYHEYISYLTASGETITGYYLIWQINGDIIPTRNT